MTLLTPGEADAAAAIVDACADRVGMPHLHALANRVRAATIRTDPDTQPGSGRAAERPGGDRE